MGVDCDSTRSTGTFDAHRTLELQIGHLQDLERIVAGCDQALAVGSKPKLVDLLLGFTNCQLASPREVPDPDRAVALRRGEALPIRIERQFANRTAVSPEVADQVRTVAKPCQQAPQGLSVRIQSACLHAQQERQIQLTIELHQRLRGELTGRRDSRLFAGRYCAAERPPMRSRRRPP